MLLKSNKRGVATVFRKMGCSSSRVFRENRVASTVKGNDRGWLTVKGGAGGWLQWTQKYMQAAVKKWYVRKQWFEEFDRPDLNWLIIWAHWNFLWIPGTFFVEVRVTNSDKAMFSMFDLRQGTFSSGRKCCEPLVKYIAASNANDRNASKSTAFCGALWLFSLFGSPKAPFSFEPFYLKCRGTRKYSVRGGWKRSFSQLLPWTSELA